MTKVLFGIAGDENKGSTRYRILNQLPKLEQYDISYRVISLPQGPNFRDKIQFVGELLRYGLGSDLIYIQRIKLPPNLVRFLTQFYTPVLYDFDDAFYTQRSREDGEKENISAFNDMLSAVTGVVAGSPAMARYAGRYSENVHTLTTPIPREDHDQVDHNDDDVITIGWIGYPENLHYLSKIESTLTDLLNAHQRLQIMIITANIQPEYPLYDRSDVHYYEWGRDTYLERLKQVDVGIRPLVDDEWTRAKSHTSIVEFMALGIPVVVSPIGILKDVIDHGTSGFHVTNEREWKMYIEALLNSTQKRSQMGDAARGEMSAHRLWSDQYAADLADVIHKTVGS